MRHGARAVDLLRNDGVAVQRGGMGGKAGRRTMMVARAQTAELWQRGRARAQQWETGRTGGREDKRDAKRATAGRAGGARG